jgi:vitamin B12 transporter
VVRASAARGFTIPPLSWTSGGGLFLDPNPELEPEKVWSYQAGIESGALKYLWAKATVFRHKLEDALVIEPYGGGLPTFNDIYINEGESRRQGIELEAETVSMYNVSLLAGFAYVDQKPPGEKGSEDIYSCNLGIRYDDGNSVRAQLLGNYVWWDFDALSKAQWGADYDDFIWDLTFNKKIYSHERTALELFFSAHNTFNGSQYTFSENKNPGRWAEAGMRFSF